MGINIGDGNKIVNSNIAEKIENTNLKEKKRFYDKHPWICGILVSLFVGIILLFSLAINPNELVSLRNPFKLSIDMLR